MFRLSIIHLNSGLFKEYIQFTFFDQKTFLLSHLEVSFDCFFIYQRVVTELLVKLFYEWLVCLEVC